MPDWAATVSAVGAAGGLIFAGREALLLRKDRVEERRLGLEGVSVEWHPIRRPNDTDVNAAGKAQWTYKFRVDNPGRFPISDVKATVQFRLPVERLEHGGHRRGVSDTVHLHHPVIRGGGFRELSRTLEMVYADRELLQQTQATVSFRDADGNTYSNMWPSR